MVTLGVIEYEITALIVVTILDVIVSTIDYFFIVKKKYRNNMLESLFVKLIIVIVCLISALFTHINDTGVFDNVTEITQLVSLGVSALILTSLYYELKSLIESYSNITGIDIENIPFINTEMDKIEKVVKKDEHKNDSK